MTMDRNPTEVDNRKKPKEYDNAEISKEYDNGEKPKEYEKREKPKDCDYGEKPKECHNRDKPKECNYSMYRNPNSMTTERTPRVFNIEKLIFIFVRNICYNFYLKGGEEAFLPAPSP